MVSHSGSKRNPRLRLPSPSLISLANASSALTVSEFPKRDRGGTTRRLRSRAARASRGPSSRKRWSSSVSIWIIELRMTSRKTYWDLQPVRIDFLGILWLSR